MADPPPVIPYRTAAPPRPGMSVRAMLARVADGVWLCFAFLASGQVLPRTTWDYSTRDDLVSGTVVLAFLLPSLCWVAVRRRPLRRWPESVLDLAGATAVVLLAGRQLVYSYTDPGWPRPRWRPDALDAGRAAAVALAVYLLLRLSVAAARFSLRPRR